MNLILNLGAVLVGGLITWYVSRRYYMKASEDLRKETSELLSLSKITLVALKNAGICELKWDKDRKKIVGLVISVSGSGHSVSYARSSPGILIAENKSDK